jgi:acetyl-CoA carboxylase biotin carboxyl carrier protein
MNIDLKQLRALLRTLADGEVSEFEYEDEQVRLRLHRGERAPALDPRAASFGVTAPPVPAVGAMASALTAPAAGDKAAPAVDDNIVTVTSPFVGTFYRAPAPDAPPYVERGLAVREGQALCIVEAMKLMNEIEAECAGIVVDILVENGKPVEYGQQLFRIRKT